MDTVTTLPRGPLRVEDLDSFPDDGHRYELIDGTLIVSPAPVLRHQLVVSTLLQLLAASCPPHLRVLTAPADVVLADDTVVQPDLLVARREDLEGAKLTSSPLLAVEVLSPSSRLIDLNLKRARYERAGVPAYWVVDPEELWVQVWAMRDDKYADVVRVSGVEAWTAAAPYAVTVIPGHLAD
jgi:Uma2 family endonuclease